MTARDSSSLRPSFPSRKGLSSTILRLLIGIGGFIVLLAAVALLIIYPLWFLATQATEWYTALFFGLIAALTVLFFFSRFRRAARNARLDEFYLKVTRFVVFLLFLFLQTFIAVVHIAWYGYLKSGSPFGIATIFFYTSGCLAALLSSALIDAALSHRFLGVGGFIAANVLFGLQGAYWTAVFLFLGEYPYVALVLLTILCFLSAKNLTKIKRGKNRAENSNNSC